MSSSLLSNYNKDLAKKSEKNGTPELKMTGMIEGFFGV